MLGLYAPASQITNSVNLTTNLVFSLGSMKTVGSQSQFKSGELIDYMLIGTSTNDIGYRHFPSGDFDFHLFEADGKEVSKTKTGLTLTSIAKKPTEADLVYWRTSHFSPRNVSKNRGEYRHLFRPDDVFMITNKGVYEMEIRIRLCVIMTNNLPDLKAMVDWRNVASHGYPFVKDFGVLTSPPLRVKVIKE